MATRGARTGFGGVLRGTEGSFVILENRRRSRRQIIAVASGEWRARPVTAARGREMSASGRGETARGGCH